MQKLKVLSLAEIGGLALAACSPGTSAEKEVEKLDSAIEEATTGDVNRDDGLLENAGEAIDEVTGAENDDPVDAVGDAIEDATDETPE
jgi:hypothetical protein